eukprot:5782724-Pyramimonas_sp.AAC.1
MAADTGMPLPGLLGWPTHGGHWSVVVAPGIYADASYSTASPDLFDSTHSRPHCTRTSDFDSTLETWASHLARGSLGDAHCEWRCSSLLGSKRRACHITPARRGAFLRTGCRAEA